MTTTHGTRPAGTPSTPLIALLLIGGVALILILNFVFTIGSTRIDYADLSKQATARPFIRQVFLPHLVIALGAAFFVTRFGLWQEIRLRLPQGVRGWVLALVAIGAAIALIDFSYLGSDGGPWNGFAALLAFGMVGINEELLFRGLGLGALTRIHGLKRAVVISTLLFGAAHGVNLFLGQSPTSTLLQVGFTTLIGFGLALFTLGTRSLIAAMVLHALWDYALTSQGWAAEMTGSIHGSGTPLTFALILTAVSVVAWRYRTSEGGDQVRAVVPARTRS